MTKKLIRSGTARSFQEMDVVQQNIDDPARKRRSDVDRAYAKVFGEAMIRFPETLTGKARKASGSRLNRVIEVFLGER